MQSTQKLIRFIRDLLGLVEEEARTNADFAARLEQIAPFTPTRVREKSERRTRKVPADAPDVFTALQTKGEAEFSFWLRSLDLGTLKLIVKANGFDPAKASQRWREPDKFVSLIATQTAARLRRGSGFLRSADGDREAQPPTN